MTKKQFAKVLPLSLFAVLYLATPAVNAQDEATTVDTEPGMSTTATRREVTNVNKSGQSGVGLQTGSLTGVTVQHWIADDSTINAAIAYSRGNTAISAAHIWMFPRATAQGTLVRDFTPYVGAGAMAAFGTQSDYFSRTVARENVAIAAQLPIGIEYLPRLERFDIFAELVPAIEISPVVAGIFTANLGARYFF